jgi:hypothetical protein
MSERDDLKARAQELNLEYAANISTAKLKELVDEAVANPSSGDAESSNNQGIGEANPFEHALSDAAKVAEGETTAPKEATAEPEFHGRKFLRVLGPQSGFRRAGRRFGAKPVDIPLDELSEAEELALKAESRLITTYHVEGVNE